MLQDALRFVVGCSLTLSLATQALAQGAAPPLTPTALPAPSPAAPPAPSPAAPPAPSPAAPPYQAAPAPLATPAAPPPVSPVDPETVRAALASWGCQALSMVDFNGRWYAACGPAGVFVVERRSAASLELAERRQGFARALYVRDGALWVELTRVEAKPVSELMPEALNAPVPVQNVAPQAVAPYAPATPPGTLVQAGGGVAPSRGESRSFPPRVGGVFLLEASLRPILPIDTLSFAGLAELGLTYRGERYWFAEARLFPFGGLVGEGKDTPVVGAQGLVGYDHPYFAVGLGAGVIMRGEVSSEWSSRLQTTLYYEDEGPAFSATQFARLGAADGLHLIIRSSFVLLDDGWQPAMAEVRGQIPVGNNTWLAPAGGGGAEAGFFYAEVGLRRLLYGDRKSGSLFARPSAGVAGVEKRDRDYDTMRPGPMVGFHIEWRK
jgi:hypothetical protein